MGQIGMMGADGPLLRDTEMTIIVETTKSKIDDEITKIDNLLKREKDGERRMHLSGAKTALQWIVTGKYPASEFATFL